METQITDKKSETQSRKPPRPVMSKGPVTVRPPAPRPLPISTREKSRKVTTKPETKKPVISRPAITETIKKTKVKETKPKSKQKQKTDKKQISRIKDQLITQSQSQVKLTQYFEDIVKPIKDRALVEGWPWIKSKKILIPPKMVTQWKTEGSLFSTIALLEFYHQQQITGEIEPDLYHRQLKSLLLEALQLLIRLEKRNSFSFEQFIEQEQIANYFPQGLEKLRLAEGSSDLDSLIDGEKIDYSELVKLPTKAADYVANGIELMDLIRLKAIATTDRILPLLDEMNGILKLTKDIFGKDYWALAEINAWRNKLVKKDPGTLLPDKDLERLEMQAVRWMNDFRRELKNI
ncbi:MAG: hypothetical protein HeimC3_18700 [Candidatus Heimdallarchaeota archaeon LC_3]|nr:MAG: hypothetical protein HeimC3_18700 [Candidatus Heimdallarchaeota archaeon LC_3]